MIEVRVGIGEPAAHQFRVSLRVARPQKRQVVSLPVWIPGSYLVREFARHLSSLGARQGGKAVGVVQLDKATWRIDSEAARPLALDYLVYAFDSSVRAAWLDRERGFFNGTSLVLRVHGFEAVLHRLVIDALPRGWQVATALPARKIDARGRGVYQAADYDELVDSPLELGSFHRDRFRAGGAPHELVVRGAAPTFDRARLAADVKRICAAQIAFWHGDGAPPFPRYVFLVNAVDEGYGGLEHRASCALITARRNLPQRGQPSASDGYVGLLGLISHEYFHAWNVKRMRPRDFARYDYASENYTRLLWFFEGFTSYYDDLLLLRAGLIDEARYLKLLAKNVNGVLGSPGRKVQSVAEASFDAWVKYYRSDENTPNATVSYYAKGSLVALALDLTLRTAGRGSLDDAMRGLWAAGKGGPVDEDDIARALQRVAGRSMRSELTAWVHGTGELPLAPLLARCGIEWKEEAPTAAQRLGLRVAESALTGVQVKSVLRESAAEAAGIASGDELIAVNGWRLRRLDDLALYADAGAAFDLVVARDQRLVTVRIVAQPGAGNVALVRADNAPADADALRRAWLAG